MIGEENKSKYSLAQMVSESVEHIPPRYRYPLLTAAIIGLVAIPFLSIFATVASDKNPYVVAFSFLATIMAIVALMHITRPSVNSKPHEYRLGLQRRSSSRELLVDTQDHKLEMTEDSLGIELVDLRSLRVVEHVNTPMEPHIGASVESDISVEA